MGDKHLFYDEMDSPIGPLLIMGDQEKIIRIDYGTMTERREQLTKWAQRYFNHPMFVRRANKVEQVKIELQAYFQEKREEFTFDFKFHGTPFQEKVWQALYESIPYGETRTYKDIAIEIGNPKAVRAVGGAVNKNPFSIVVPCHRVIGANGKMVGYNGGLDKKEYLLAHESK